MKRVFTYLMLVLIIAVIGIASFFVFVNLDEDEPNENGDPPNGETPDTEPPEFLDVTGDITVSAGDFASVVISFQDNVEVTNATLFYRIVNASSWIEVNVLSSNFDLETPSEINRTWEYYVVIDDAAGNGPVGEPSIDGSITYTITATYEPEPNGSTYTHTVFIEESTATNCKNCPIIGDRIETLYASEEYNILYVNLVNDVNVNDANERVAEYNVYGDPTIFIDGGYRVFVGSGTTLNTIKKAVRDAEARDKKEITINISATYNNESDSIVTDIVATNHDSFFFEGNLRVYLVEKVSQWNDYNGSKYKNAFLEYRINQDILILANSESNYTDSFPVNDLDPENLLLIAVIFEQETNQGYANPPDANPFDAHYAVASASAEVIEGGNLPPSVGISSPLQGKAYWRDRLILNFIYNIRNLRNTHLLGPNTITAVAEDDSAIVNVEFYINGELVYNDTEAPYAYTPASGLGRTPLIPRKTTIEVVAYDDGGKNSAASMEVFAFRTFKRS